MSEENLDFIQISHILDGEIYIGNCEGAGDLELLKSYEIKIIVNCSTEVVNFFEDHFTYFNIRVADLETHDILQHFSSFYNIVESYQGPFFVHCVGGISRSSTLVISYVMKKQSLRFTDSYNLVRSRRKCIYPNTGFVKQLLEWEKLLFGDIEDSEPAIIPPDNVKIVKIDPGNEEEIKRIVYDNPEQIKNAMFAIPGIQKKIDMLTNKKCKVVKPDDKKLRSQRQYYETNTVFVKKKNEKSTVVSSRQFYQFKNNKPIYSRGKKAPTPNIKSSKKRVTSPRNKRVTKRVKSPTRRRIKSPNNKVFANKNSNTGIVLSKSVFSKRVSKPGEKQQKTKPPRPNKESRPKDIKRVIKTQSLRYGNDKNANNK